MTVQNVCRRKEIGAGDFELWMYRRKSQAIIWLDIKSFLELFRHKGRQSKRTGTKPLFPTK